MLIFLLPITINSVHDFMNHEHSVCTSKVVKHIHEKDSDCDIHLLKQNDTFLVSNTFKTNICTIILKSNNTNYTFLKNHPQLSFSLRGPPQII